MKLWGALAVLGVLALTWSWCSVRSSPYSYHYRMTVEINTPDGVKFGSSVFEFRVRDITKPAGLPIKNRVIHTELFGEAVFIDLGHGKNVLASNSSTPGSVDMIRDAVRTLFGQFRIENYDRYEKSDYTQVNGGPREVPQWLHPTIISFRDLTDPASAVATYAIQRGSRIADGHEIVTARVVVDRFAEILGPGYSLKRVTIEPTRNAVTRDLANKIPWINNRGPGITPPWWSLPEMERTAIIRSIGR